MTALEEGEILTEVELPYLPANTRWGFEEFAQRSGDFAIVAAAVTATLSGEKCDACRIAVIGGEMPIRLRSRGSSSLAGIVPTAEHIKTAATIASEAAEWNKKTSTPRATSENGPRANAAGCARADGCTFALASGALMTEMHHISVRINGVRYDGQVEARMLLSDFLRETLRMTGTHVGCEHGVCGACTIIADGHDVPAHV